MLVIELHDPSDVFVQRLSGATKAGFHPVLNSDGSGTFDIHRTDPDVARYSILTGGIDGWIVHVLRKGQFDTTFTDRFSFVVEAVTVSIGASEDSSTSESWLHVSGRGTLCLLEDRIAFPPGFDGVNPATISAQWQQYTAQAGGAIMDGEIDRSNGRFGLQLTHSVQTSTVPQTVKLRFDNLRLLHDYLVQNGTMDAQMAGLDYQAVDHLGTDKSASITVAMAPKDSLIGVQLERDARNVKTWVIAQGTAEGINAPLAVSSDAAAIAALRRREGFVSTRNTDNAAQLGLVAAGAIRQYKGVDQRITTAFFDSEHTQLYRDVALGDTIMLKVGPLNWTAPYRVVGFAVADTEIEQETIALDLNDMRTEYLLKLQKGAQATATSLNVLATQPQGAPQIDSQAYPDSADATHPFHFDFYLSPKIIQLNHVTLSFFLRAFRSDVQVTGTNTGNSTVGDHSHETFADQSATVATPAQMEVFHDGNGNPFAFVPGAGTVNPQSFPGGGFTHAHPLNISAVYGIFESTVATNVKVIVNGIDRTVALGGPAGGFITNQTELAIDTSWLTPGVWNTIDLQPGGLGRITGHLTVVSFIQSV